MTIQCLHLPTRVILFLCAMCMVFGASNVEAQNQTRSLRGVVVNEEGLPFVGVAVTPAGFQGGTVTEADGSWQLRIPASCDSVRFAFTGYIRQSVHWSDVSRIKMVVDEQVIDNVVVTGVYTRKAESYTGASVTISGNDLRKLGNQNVLQSLRYADPTVYIAENLTMGSDPNTVPTVSMRGTSSIPTTSSIELKGNYQTDPNQPLFILDGFETTAEKVMDMDMNRVQSVTILKDAAAKALYGSKAANGVIVIETKNLASNRQLVTYNFSLDIEMPDLTSYNLCNAAEKLEVERIEGVYTASSASSQYQLDQLYNSRYQSILEGLDTYWLAKPLRLGVGHKHNISVETGDSQSLRSVIDFTYDNNAGVMIGSKRENIEGNINISYKRNNIIFRNVTNVISNHSEDSPYGDFSTYAAMNPYLASNDPVTGEVLRWAESLDSSGNTIQIANPMYDAEIGTMYTSSYLYFSNNFYTEYDINKALKLTARLGVTAKRSDADEFLPAQHSTFADVYSTEDKGSYDYETGTSSSLSGDVYINYNKTFKEHHNLYATAGAQMSETQYSVYQFSAEGFSNLQSADMSFARQYAEGTTPVSIASLNRELSFLANASYDYDSRYLADVTLRQSASSLFGSSNRWSTSWAVGLGWNLHNEDFMSGISWLEQFKIRGSLGVTGNQNFATNEALATYTYYTDVTYAGLTGAYLNNMPNSELMWEEKYDTNIGFDARLFGLSISFDVYNSVTENMLTDLSISTSSGFSTVKDNLGRVRNYGIEASLSYNVITSHNGFLNVFGNIATTNNEIVSLSESLENYNNNMLSLAEDKSNSTPVLIYQDGYSMNTIWAVPSAGIDPSTGNEIYIKKDGTLTYTYDSDDLVAAGDATIKYRGNFGFTGEWENIGMSLTMSYYAGGQMYNYTLVDRVENADISGNVDKRVLTGRWQEAGQEALYKLLGTYTVEGVSTQEVTRATTRFVQNYNQLNFGSLSLYYEFPTEMISKLKMQRLRASWYINNFATISSIDIERGLTYPFSRTMSFALSATF